MRSFVREYFDDKPLNGPRSLKASITPDWSDANAENHLALIGVPDDAERVYEIGAGIGRLLSRLKDTHMVAGCDASPSMVREQIDGCNIIECDGDGSVPIVRLHDFVFSIVCFQHIPDTATVKRYIAEAYAILRPGGSFAFQVLADDVHPGRELWTYHDLGELLKCMDSVGFLDGGIEIVGVWAVIRGDKPE